MSNHRGKRLTGLAEGLLIQEGLEELPNEDRDLGQREAKLHPAQTTPHCLESSEKTVMQTMT